MAVIKHREQFPDFRLRPLPFSEGNLIRLLEFNCSRVINLTALYEYLIETLAHVQFVLTNGVSFSLVNVYSPFTGFSHGLEGPPPQEIVPSNCHLLFTFAISSDHYYAGKPVAVHSKRSLFHSLWSYDSRPRFVSIGISNTSDMKFGTHRLAWRELEFIYNMIGCLTKVWVLNPSAEISKNMAQNKQRYYLESLMEILKEPFAALSYNKEIWEYLPGVVKLTPDIAYYYLECISKDHSSRSVYDLRTKLGIDIHAMVVDSILWFVQNITQPTSSGWDIEHMLAPALIVARMTGSRLPFGPDNEILSELRHSTESLMATFKDNELDVNSILSPAHDVATKLIYGDAEFADRLLTLVG